MSPLSTLRRPEPSLGLPSASSQRGSAERPREGLQVAGKNNIQSCQHIISSYFIPGVNLLLHLSFSYYLKERVGHD